MAKTVPGYLGPYRLLNVIHTGHGSQLWQAYDDGKQRMVAVKALLPQFAKDSEHIGYLRREYKVGLQVVHQRIIEVYSLDTDHGIPYLGMEWFGALNLKRRIRSKEDREKLAYLVPKILVEAAEGLGWMHHIGWVHRDVKPDNFLVDEQGQAKLIDFGLALRAQHGWGKLLTRRSKRQGTPSYMAPEQIRCQSVDERMDVYAFGCMAYEMFAGNPPFTGSTREELFTKHLKAPPPSLEAVDSNVTAEFAQWLRRCLAKDPAKRPASAHEMLGDLRTMRIFKSMPRRPSSAAS
ncbi:MAG: serine/threonine-protein kinase [Thermoguttaceae bacterium]